MTQEDCFILVMNKLTESKIPFSVETEYGPTFLEINYNGLRGVIYNSYVYSEDKRIFLDHSKLYNKMGDCAIKLQLPKNDLQMQFLFDCMKIVSSKQYFKSIDREKFEEYPSGRILKKKYKSIE